MAPSLLFFCLGLVALACPSSGSKVSALDSGPGTGTGAGTGTATGTTGSTETGTVDGGDAGTGGTTTATGPACVQDAVGVAVGTLGYPDLTEASGLVESRTRDGVLWSHNDSGGGTVLYAMDSTGASLGTVSIEGATARDWEDLAAGPFNGVASLFIGDIGDNGRNREDITVFVLTEPVAGADSAKAQAITLHYPDGAHDAEALIIDPLTGDLYIVTKDLGGVGTVFRAQAPLKSDITLVDVAEMDLASDKKVSLAMVTGGDVSPDGRCVALRTYGSLVAWERDPDQPLYQAFSGPTLHLVVESEPQGESVALGAGHYWTVSEGKSATIYRYQAAR